MASITQLGALNTTALIVPDLYVQIVPPQTTLINGVPTNILGIVGTAQWGPVNTPVIMATMADYSRNFGQIQSRLYDMGTGMALAVLQGASNFRGVRVTDGTDTAATSMIASATGAGSGTGLTLTGLYTGTLGNNLVWNVTTGSSSTTANPTWRLAVSIPGQLSEIYDNIGGTGVALWSAMAKAVNQGNSPFRGPSKLVIATAGSATAAPVVGNGTFAGGTDGASGVVSSTLVGTDGVVPRTGMYALRGSGASVAFLCDAFDSTQWTTQVVFGLSEGIYMIGVGPVGDTIANAVSVKANAGIDSYAFKLMFGDWVFWSDSVNNVIRLVSPQGIVAGKLANLAPQGSTLNKQLYGIIGTQRSMGSNGQYSAAELQALIQAGIDVICNPAPGGSYFAARAGHNSSSNAVIHGDNYSRMTNYIAATLAAGMGIFVGQLQTPTERLNAKATLDAYFAALAQQGQIGSADGSTPWLVTLDNTNNPPSQVALGYQQADVKVIFLSVIEKFLVNVEGGQSVTINRTSTQALANAA